MSLKTATRAGRLLSPLALAACLTMAGCASVQMPAPTASAENVQRLRAANLAATKVGSFALAPGRDAKMDTELGGLRGSSITPAQGSFARQLRDTLVAELGAAGLVNEASPLLIEGWLTDSQVDAAISKGTGRLAARFTVKRSGRQVYDKELAADATWESSFMGAVAIPAAINQYTALYKALVTQLLDDPAFRTALAR